MNKWLNDVSKFQGESFDQWNHQVHCTLKECDFYKILVCISFNFTGKGRISMLHYEDYKKILKTMLVCLHTFFLMFILWAIIRCETCDVLIGRDSTYVWYITTQSRIVVCDYISNLKIKGLSLYTKKLSYIYKKMYLKKLKNVFNSSTIQEGWNYLTSTTICTV